MDNSIFVGFSETPLLADKAIDFVQSNAHGATNLFIGKVRDFNMGKAVIGVSYEAYTPLGLVILKEICCEAKHRFGENLRCYVEHYTGRLCVGEMSVVIAVSAIHRAESFQACHYLIEELKHRAPIWKKEHYIDHSSEWVQGHALCQHHR